MKKLTFNIPITDSYIINDLMIVSSNMEKIPSRTFIHDVFSSKSFNDFLSREKVINTIINTDLIPNFDDYISNERYLVCLESGQWLSYLAIDNQISDVCIFYDGDCENILSEIKSCSLDNEDESINRTNLLSVSSGVLDLNPLFIQDDMSISICHSKSTVKEIKNIVKSIETRSNSISILRGPRGSGKTTICKWISNHLDDVTIFIPNNLIDHSINNPEFRNFISKFEKCTIIIDDCEFNNRQNNLICNIIQIADTYAPNNVHFILSYNVDETYEIDDDLYECSSFEREVFLDLPNGKFATEISKKLDLHLEYKSEQTLSDIFRGKSSKARTKNIGIE